VSGASVLQAQMAVRAASTTIRLIPSGCEPTFCLLRSSQGDMVDISKETSGRKWSQYLEQSVKDIQTETDWRISTLRPPIKAALVHYIVIAALCSD